MRIEHGNCVSSQQSPNTYYHYEHEYKESLYSRMFLEDFAGWFSSEFTAIGMSDGFYDVTPEGDSLKKLLQFNSYSYFHHDFDNLLSQITHYLILNGKTYLEVVSWKNSQNVIQGIDLIPVPAKYRHKSYNKSAFVTYSFNKNTTYFSIDQKRLVIFDLKDLGFHRNYFRKLIEHLTEFDVTNLGLMENPKMNGIFDFNEYQKLKDYKLLKMTKSTHWLGRNYSNQYLSESYLLYRTAQYKMLRYKFLEYILYKINEGLYRFQAEWNFSGKIYTTFTLPNYRDTFNQYNKGIINASQLCEIVVKNLSPQTE